MSGDPKLLAFISLLLILGNAFFVAAEYALVGVRRSRVEAMARKGRRNAKGVLRVLQDISPYVAATQIGITMVGILVGSVTEPFVTHQLTGLFKALFGQGVSPTVGFVISYLIITFVLVVIGELFPKYLALRASDKVVMYTTGPLVFFARVLTPLVWIAQVSASVLLRPFGIRMKGDSAKAMPREELLLLIRSGSMEGTIDKVHAELLSRALKLDALDARDLMIHRLDIKYIDINTPKSELFRKLANIPHNRIPVCREDLDDLSGVVYLHDIVRTYEQPDFSLEKLVKPVPAVPENLSVDKIVDTMREAKTQILIVMDEYGGTRGLITLEDIVEEIFGELEDRLESSRPPIEVAQGGRISARADVRFDELVAKLGIDLAEEPSTDTLATIMVNSLGRVPRTGDKVETEIGALSVENMARRRITRVSVFPKANLEHIDRDL